MARTLRYILVLLFTSVSGLALAQSGSIYGTILDENKEPVPNAQIFVFSGGLQKGAVITDFDGNYSVKPLDAGNYDLRVNYSGYKSEVVEGVIVTIDGGTKVDLGLEPASVPAANTGGGTGTGTTTGGAAGTSGGRTIATVEVRVSRFKKPLIEPTAPGSRTVLLAEDIERMPTRNPLDAASTAPGVYSNGRNSDRLNIGGGRGENTLYVIDGIVQVGNRGVTSLPFGSIAQMSVITGGLPARYGDATGGVVSITTKGVTSRVQGSVGGEHSVDGFNNRQGYFNLSGPLLSRVVRDTAGNIVRENGKTTRRPVIGFALSGNYIDNQDASPSYYGNYVAKDEVRRELEAAPLVAVQGLTGLPTLRNATEFRNEGDFEIQKRRPRAASTDGSLLGKLDFQLGNNMNLTLGAQGFYGMRDDYNRRLIQFSQDAISQTKEFTGRGFLRFTQRFPQRSGDSNRVISNAFYSLQADYQKETTKRQDPRFKDEIFKYGYLGKFYQTDNVNYTPGFDTATNKYGIRLNPGFTSTGARFERSDLNPVLANYTSTVFDLVGEGVGQGDIRNIRQFNGLLNGDQPEWTYSSVFSNVGTWQSNYFFANNDQLSVGVDASLDLKSRKTTHSLEFGLYYQQRTQRSYSLDASLSDQGGTQSLWERAFQLTNTHFDENFDYGNPIFVVDGVRYTKDDVKAGRINPAPDDTILYNYISRGNQSTFDRNLRTKLGLDPDGTDFINVYEVDPSQLSVDMFGADELFNAGRSHVRYFGYDYKGERSASNVTFNDFFTAKDENGRYTRPVGAFRPNYIAGYLSDNFKFRDVLFNVGVRVDRYDANTKVLKDPYSLYEVRKQKDISGSLNVVNNGQHPGNIGSEYVVYVDNNNSQTPQIAGYRNGDDWYTPEGRFVDDPNFLKAFTNGTDPQPYLVNPNIRITDTAFDPNTSFTDYIPQVNVMPRISFSFPIADQSLFYAHYNIVVQRPRSGVALSPLDYYFLQTNPTRIINNPDLRPERNTDYEIGFQQAITKGSAITLSAFYKERKDQIQIRPYLFAWPTTYYTYGNRDFSTTKGLRVKYDLRRVGPFQMLVSYTLQFVEGTGSGASDQNRGRTDQIQSNGILSNFIAAQLPNLRFPFALNYDSRHNFVVNADYRYFQGQGPEIFGTRPLQNAGANLIFRTRSGEPYTRYADPISGTIQGGVNGARLPWHYMLDLNVDKDFSLRSNKARGGEGTGGTASARTGRGLYLNAFVYVRNLLNTRDVIQVYGYSGRPDDNGYLSHPIGQQTIEQQLDQQAYTDQYTIGNLDPNYLNLPRQVTLGLRMNF